MIDRKARSLALIVAPLVLGFLYVVAAPFLNAEQSNIRQTDSFNVIHAGAVSALGTFTQDRAFTPLHRTTTQTVQVQGTGTSPNYKVELLCMIDGKVENGTVTGTFVKPELGGDIGTFTDANPHMIPLFGPLALAHKLQITELGNHALTVEAWEASQ